MKVKNNSRLFWKRIKTIMGFKKKSVFQAADENTLASDINAFYTRFDQQDFRTQQAQAMEKVRDQLAQPFSNYEGEVCLNFRSINCRSASRPDNVSDKILKLCSDSLAPLFLLSCSRGPSTKDTFQESGRPLP